ncbi:hypothetical protein WR25_22419 [Diploscapter pachys]|uniref:G-protein coupled receptors family 1 profile domain-containing protein n=1 Tax=Diploscapter pachys TaxID=2018661 RepID=A0A2A2LU65_9BILA|nr:hypothetical protein WR25_22419 [Diploscapter pachys]
MEYFYMWNAYRIFFYKVQVLCIYLTNVFSSMTSYFILAVSVERSFGVRTPLQLQYTWRAKKVITTMILIAWISCTLCGYHLIEYKHGFTMIMNGTTLYGMPINIATIPSTSKTLLKLIKYWKTAQIIFTIFVPTICISILNIQIILVLRKSEFLLLQQQQQQNSDSTEHPAVRSRSSDHEARNRRDLKVTFTVLAIIGCYIVTHVPSAVPFILEIFEKHSVFMSMYYQPLSNCWTLMGKVANFVLFCLSSVYFRKRLMKILKRRINAIPFLRRRQKKYSGVSSERSIKSQAIKLQKYKNGNDKDSAHRQSSIVTQLE